MRTMERETLVRKAHRSAEPRTAGRSGQSQAKTSHVAMSCRSANPAFTDQEWQLNALMKETLLTFLTRIAFLLGDAQKDLDAPLLLKHALGLLDDTLALWPNVPVKMSFLNRMLEANLQQSLDPPPALLIGEPPTAVMLRLMSVNPECLDLAAIYMW